MRGIFESDEEIFKRAGASDSETHEVLEISKKALFKGGLNPANVEAVLLYRHIKEHVEPCISARDSSRIAGVNPSIAS